MAKSNIDELVRHAQGQLQQGNFPQARQSIQSARLLAEQHYANNANAWFTISALYGMLGDFKESEACAQRGVKLQPDSIQGWVNYGNAIQSQGRTQESIDMFRRALALGTKHPQARLSLTPAYINLANALCTVGSLEEAVESQRKAIASKPGDSELHNTLGVFLSYQGKINESIESHARALQLRPDHAAAHSNLLLILHYQPDIDAAAIFAEHCRWVEMHVRPGPRQLRHANTSDPERRLRVGYVSMDFRSHSVAFFIEPVLAQHDSAAFDITCYSTGGSEDFMTRRLQALASRWHNVAGMTDEQLCHLIETDGIDILVDLSGHTSSHRLRAFALKPSPVQVTYLGYPDTTGLPAMDYRLTDIWADPPGESDKLNTESLVRIPAGFLCYQPPADAPSVTPPPSQEKGYITFGSFNNLAKINPGVIALWARLLQAVPDARLILKYPWLSDEPTRELYYAQFAEHGIMQDRLELLKKSPTTAEHLAVYARMDVALDTFPYNGTTTTCEALWMGVPVVTLAGNRHSGRVGASLLSQVGLSDCIASTTEDYIECAVGLAADKNRLMELRATLRHKMTASSLCDAVGFTRKIEEAYRTMWRAWCEKK